MENIFKLCYKFITRVCTHTSEEDRSQIFYASLLILYVRPSLSNTWMDWFAFFQPGRKFFENSKLVSRCLTIVSKPGQSSFKVVNTLQNMRIDFYVFHWSWYSIQFDCTISSQIHLWREYRVLMCWKNFSEFFTVVKYAPWNCFCNAQSFEWKKMLLNKCPICTIFDFVYWKTLLKVNARI